MGLAVVGFIRGGVGSLAHALGRRIHSGWRGSLGRARIHSGSRGFTQVRLGFVGFIRVSLVFIQVRVGSLGRALDSSCSFVCYSYS